MMVPCDWSSKTASALLVMGVDVQFRSYDAAHDLEEEEVGIVLFYIPQLMPVPVK